MNRETGLLARFYNNLLIVLNNISVITIFITAVWIFGDVIGRFFLNRPIPGTTELIKTAILAIIFLGVAYTLQQKAHIRTTVLIRKVPEKVASWFEVVSCIIGIIIFTLVSVYGWEAAVKAWQVQEFEGVQLRVPTYPSRFIMVLGSVLLVIQYTINLVSTFRTMKEQKKGNPA